MENLDAMSVEERVYWRDNYAAVLPIRTFSWRRRFWWIGWRLFRRRRRINAEILAHAFALERQKNQQSDHDQKRDSEHRPSYLLFMACAPR
jgi:hypothetical protein